MSPLSPTLNSAWSQSWYPSTMAQLVEIAGIGGSDDDNGTQVPNLSAIDTMALLGLVTPAVVSAIVRFNKDANGAPAELSAVRSDCVDSDGRLTGAGPRPSPYVDAKTYLTYQTDVQSIGLVSDTPWKRFPTNESTTEFVESFEVWSASPLLTPNQSDSNNGLLQFIRQMIADWQRMVTASSFALSTNAADVTAPAPFDTLLEFLSAMRALCADFDVLNENPPELAKITDALKFALAKSSEFVGKAAAEISNEVGKQAGIIGGNLTEGFLSNAGILSFIVVGIVVHLFLS